MVGSGGILIVLLVLLILMSTFAPNFNRVDNLLNIARSISVNAILAAGMTFVILTSGIDLSVGSIVAVSGVVSVVAAMAGLPAPLAILAGVGVGALCGLLNGVLTAYLARALYRHSRHDDLPARYGLHHYRRAAYCVEQPELPRAGKWLSCRYPRAGHYYADCLSAGVVHS